MDLYLILLLPWLVLTPLVGGVLLMLPRVNREAPARTVAMTNTIINLVIAGIFAYNFDWNHGEQIQFAFHFPWITGFGLEFGMGLDALSMWFILLTTFLMPLVVLGSFSAVDQKVSEFYLWLLILEAAIIGAFLATDMLFFYVCFEFGILPLFLLIGIYGSNDRRRAAKVFFLYTFVGAALTLAGLIYVAWFNTTLNPAIVPSFGHWTFNIRELYAAAQQMSESQQMWVLLAMMAGFGVKVPLFPFHTWLPLAHTEAPTAGSVDLAALLLKLGTYGILRFVIPMTPLAFVKVVPAIAVIAIIGVLYGAVICWVQKDVKRLIAYSSVSHLGMCVLGLVALNSIAVGGSVMYMINHGLSTGALFMLIGMVYERFHTRQMKDMSGLARMMPVWAFFMVFFTLSSVGLPGLNGFVGEFLVLLGTFQSRDLLGPGYAAVAGVGMILSAIYLLFMLGKVVWGPIRVPHVHAHRAKIKDHLLHGPSTTPGGHHLHDEAEAVGDLDWREIATLVPIAVVCLVLGLYPTPFLKSIESNIHSLTAPAVDATTALVERRESAHRTAMVTPPSSITGEAR